MHRLAAPPIMWTRPGIPGPTPSTSGRAVPVGGEATWRWKKLQQLPSIPTERRIEIVTPGKVAGRPRRGSAPRGRDLDRGSRAAADLGRLLVDGDVTTEISVFVDYSDPRTTKNSRTQASTSRADRSPRASGRMMTRRRPPGRCRGRAQSTASSSRTPPRTATAPSDAYLQGGVRPSQGAQRGSVVDMPGCTGDPSERRASSTTTVAETARSRAARGADEGPCSAGLGARRTAVARGPRQSRWCRRRGAARCRSVPLGPGPPRSA